jgi:hypothetical protein
MNAPAESMDHGRIWSLWDMINFGLSSFCAMLTELKSQRDLAIERAQSKPIDVSDKRLDGIVSALQSMTDMFQMDSFSKDVANNLSQRVRVNCGKWGIVPALARIERLEMKLRQPVGCSYSDYANDLNTLIEIIEDHTRHITLFLCDAQESEYLIGIDLKWHATLGSFPSAKEDIFGAMQCFAFGQYTASVFHSMRVAEYGLRALARERQVTMPKGKLIDWSTWQEIIREISKSVDGMAANMPAGPTKDAALDFYRGAVAHFQAFKDKDRNVVMHVRRSYDIYESARVLAHVRDFMNSLSAKINEKTRRPIGRWP